MTQAKLEEWRASAAFFARPGPGRKLSVQAIALMAERILTLCDEVERLRAAVTAARQREEEAKGEIARLKETNSKLNRRCQSAESGLAAKLTGGFSFGRALANSAAVMYKARAEKAEEENDRLTLAASESARTLQVEITALHVRVMTLQKAITTYLNASSRLYVCNSCFLAEVVPNLQVNRGGR